MKLLGVDTGGTFTDFVWFDGEKLGIHKVLSTPQAPEQAILQGIRELGLQQESFYLVHGSTVATNAVLEGKGGPHRLYHQLRPRRCFDHWAPGTARAL